MDPASSPLGRTLGTGGDWRRRLLLHYAPLAIASAVVLILFMTLSPFDVNKYLPGDIFSGMFPQDFPEGDSPAEHGAGETRAQQGAGEQPPRQQGGHRPPEQQGGRHQPPQQQDGGGSGEQQSGGDPSHAPRVGGRTESTFLGLKTRRFTVASGYVATGLLALTLLIGPANLALRRRNPVSSYLRRDVGAWTAIFSGIHVIYGLQVHGSGKVSDYIDYFIVDGDPLTNSFGWGNWTGLAALVIAAALLALSSDLALRKLKAGPWKWLQRMNYALVLLVVAHAFFYGALLRLESPFTILLICSVVAVFIGQAAGVWLWRGQHARTIVTLERLPG